MVSESAIATTFLDVEKLLHIIVWRFRKLYYTGDWDRRISCSREELFAQATVLFMRAYYGHEEGKSSFTTFLYHTVWYGLLDHVKKEVRRAQPYDEGGTRIRVIYSQKEVEAAHQHQKETFDLAAFLDELSHDSRAIVMIVLDTPKGLSRAMRNDNPNPSSPGLNELRRYLKGLGWSALKITDCFKEIREVLRTW